MYFHALAVCQVFFRACWLVAVLGQEDGGVSIQHQRPRIVVPIEARVCHGKGKGPVHSQPESLLTIHNNTEVVNETHNSHLRRWQ